MVDELEKEARLYHNDCEQNEIFIDIKLMKASCILYLNSQDP